MIGGSIDEILDHTAYPTIMDMLAKTSYISLFAMVLSVHVFSDHIGAFDFRVLIRTCVLSDVSDRDLCKFSFTGCIAAPRTSGSRTSERFQIVRYSRRSCQMSRSTAEIQKA